MDTMSFRVFRLDSNQVVLDEYISQAIEYLTEHMTFLKFHESVLSTNSDVRSPQHKLRTYVLKFHYNDRDFQRYKLIHGKIPSVMNIEIPPHNNVLWIMSIK